MARKPAKPKAASYAPRERLSSAGYLSESAARDWIRSNVAPGATFTIATHTKALSGQIIGFWEGTEPLIDPWTVRELVRAGDVVVVKRFWRGIIATRNSN